MRLAFSTNAYMKFPFEEAAARIASMYVSVAATAQAGAGSEVHAEDVDQRFAESESSGLVADQRAKNIAGFQHDAEGGADGLLSFAQVNSTGDLSSPPKASQLFFGRPCQQHPIKGVDVLFPRNRGNNFPL